MAVKQIKTWEQNYTRQLPKTEPKVVIRRKGWVTKGEKILYAFFAVIFLLFAGYMVSYAASTDTLNREIQTLETKVQDQKLKIASLEFEVKELQRPERIIKKAKEKGFNIQNSEVKHANGFQ